MLTITLLALGKVCCLFFAGCRSCFCLATRDASVLRVASCTRQRAGRCRQKVPDTHGRVVGS